MKLINLNKWVAKLIVVKINRTTCIVVGTVSITLSEEDPALMLLLSHRVTTQGKYVIVFMLKNPTIALIQMQYSMTLAKRDPELGKIFTKTTVQFMACAPVVLKIRGLAYANYLAQPRENTFKKVFLQWSNGQHSIKTISSKTPSKYMVNWFQDILICKRHLSKALLLEYKTIKLLRLP